MAPGIPAESWLSPKVGVRPSPIHGLGLFAREPIQADQPVIVLGGEAIGDEEVARIIARGERYDGIGLGNGLSLVVDSSHPAARGNHSCDGNLWMDGAVTFVARRDIAPDEEVTIDYVLFTSDPDWFMQCRCGAATCRRTVTGMDWQRADVQARYSGHFAPFIEGNLSSKTR